MMRAKILHLDIETAPIVSYHWGLWQQNISLNQIIHEWSILSFTGWWEHDAERGYKRSDIIYMDCRDNEDVHDDSALMAKLWELLNEADFVVAQNGVKFDMKKMKARFILLGFPPFKPVKVIDTLLIAKRVFGFTSNKLEWMATYFSKVSKRKHGKFPGFELWVQCMAGNPEAWDEMELYNIDDVRSMREVWLELRPWAEQHPNLAAMWPDDELRCGRCGSDELTQDGYEHTNVGKYKSYCCDKCGGYSRSRYTLNTLAKRQATLTN